MKRLILAVSLLVAVVFAQTAIEGTWEGAIQIQTVELGIIVNFQKSGDSLTATIDIPQQNAMGLHLERVNFVAPKVHFELKAGLTSAVFDGKLEADTVKGDFEQGPAKGKFYLVRKEEVEVPPPPYKEEEVSIKVSDQVTLAGTLTLPRDSLKHPAVVLITGSGTQDRNEQVFGFKIFGIIADYLTRSGIAVLRCDDRGFGKSTGKTDSATTKEFADDARAQVAYLKTRTEVDTSRIGFLGHSEGGLIATMVAADSPGIAFVVLMAGPALPGEDILLAQQALILKSQGASDGSIEEASNLQKRIYAALRSGEGLDELRPEIRKAAMAEVKAIPPKERKALGNLNEFVDRQLDAQFEMIQSPWFRFFLDYDPRPDLAKISARVLAFYGCKDLQVPSQMDSTALVETFNAAGKTNYLIKVCGDANHLFQKAITGAISEYATLPKEFVPCFLPNVANWILGLPEVPCPGCGAEGTSGTTGCKENPNPSSPSSGCGGCPHAAEHNK